MRTLFTAASGVALLLVSAAYGQQTQQKGLPPRATPSDYQAHAQAGGFTLAAEFTDHNIPDPQASFETEDYIGVEVAVFGPVDAKLKLSIQDFSLRLNGKKAQLPAQEFSAVFKSLKDPAYAPPAAEKTKNGMTSGAKGETEPGAPPAVVHVPIEVQRSMQQRVQKAAFPEGERALPIAGLVFFEHRGKVNSVELIYSGPAGKATLVLR